MKKCNRCKQEKDKKEFYKNKYRKDGLEYVCKICFKKKVNDTNTNDTNTNNLLEEIKQLKLENIKLKEDIKHIKWFFDNSDIRINLLEEIKQLKLQNMKLEEDIEKIRKILEDVVNKMNFLKEKVKEFQDKINYKGELNVK